MIAPKASVRYRSLAIILHWLTLAILIAVYACINLADLFPKGSDPREALKTWHFMLGLTVLAVVTLRFGNRLRSEVPPVIPPLPIWQNRLAHAVHIVLYIFMAVMPILGWLLLSAAGKPIPFFGLHLPALVAASKELAGQVKDVHETIGTVGYYLIGGHALAALYHHFISRDNTLMRMLPRWR